MSYTTTKLNLETAATFDLSHISYMIYEPLLHPAISISSLRYVPGVLQVNMRGEPIKFLGIATATFPRW